ncbi:G1/S-specific cyclin-E1 [Thelohanellus kitauei]|uniref:G1/S-specific cyclin-E1 n=1 Tax=Thelohanellus kitauei TaxID=669202 RepID=A0A0C2INK5_THEKT|nr:G1/S-specific cyclin-E1 [Thelohanellus kitauei]
MKIRGSAMINHSTQLIDTRVSINLRSQKRSHFKAKSQSSSQDDASSTPACSSFILPRRPSFPNSGIGKFITPHTSIKTNLSMRSRSNSSGYNSINKSKTRSKKAYQGLTKSIRNLNIVSLVTDATPNSKIFKTKFYPQPQPTNLSCAADTSDSYDLLDGMIKKESVYQRDPNCFMKQSHVNAKMRSVLIDWMKEVCDAFQHNLETLYLAVDYLDRYLSSVKDVPVHSFQTIGTTCLFIASKLNEIHPFSIESFSNVTDGASTVAEILLHEAHILLKINWHLQPVTPISWLQLFLQLFHSQNDHTELPSSYRGPVTRKRYVQSFEKSYLARKFLICDETINKPYIDLLESCIRDAGSLQFPYSVIAASIISLVSRSHVFNITGYGSSDISNCKKWLRQFYQDNTTPLKESTVQNMPGCDQIGIPKIGRCNRMSLNCEFNEKENIPPLAC